MSDNQDKQPLSGCTTRRLSATGLGVSRAMQIGDLRDVAALHGWRVQRFPEDMDDTTIDLFSRGHLLVHVHYDAAGNATRGYRSRLGQRIDSATLANDQAIRRAVATWLERF